LLLRNSLCIARAIIFSAILTAGIIRISEASSLLGTEANGLFTIDDNTAEAGLVGNVQFGSGTLILSTLEFGADGTLLGTQFEGLYTIDPTTGIAGLVGNVQFGGGTLNLSTLEFGADGTLLGTQFEGLYTIDPTTGIAGLVGNVQFGGGTLNLSTLAFDVTLAFDGTLFGTAANGLYTIDPTTGIAGLVGNVQFGGGTLNLSTLATWPFVIDIKPNDGRNLINLCAKGPLSVAILSSEAFDAPTEVDPATVQLAGAGVKTVGANNQFLTQTRDVNGDGFTDLILKIVSENLDLEPGDTEAELTGRTFGGMPIEGTGAVEVEERMCLRKLE
jgi:hypothetical protein